MFCYKSYQNTMLRNLTYKVFNLNLHFPFHSTHNILICLFAIFPLNLVFIRFQFTKVKRKNNFVLKKSSYKKNNNKSNRPFSNFSYKHNYCWSLSAFRLS